MGIKVVIYLVECDMLLHQLLAMHIILIFFFHFVLNRAWISSGSGEGPELEIKARFMSFEWSGKFGWPKHFQPPCEFQLDCFVTSSCSSTSV